MEPDDYFNNGLFEMARFGTHTIMKNNMDDEQRQKLLNNLKRRYPKLKKKINRLVASIRKQVTTCDPVQLLTFSSDMFLMSNLGITSEIQSSKEDIFISRMTEYIQSILVSSSLRYKKSKKDPTLRFYKIQRKITKLYKLIDAFYFSWSACGEDLYPQFDDEIRRVVVESQFLYWVRGQRYQVFEIEYYDRLLKSHNDIFVSLFGISYNEIIEGIKKLQYSLSQGKLDAVNELGALMDDFFDSGETDVEKFREMHPNAGKDFADKFAGTKLRNVIDITGWPEEFVKSLSWEIGECHSFYNECEFSGWPIIDLPIQKRPFIKIEENYYCFDYYSFVDNFYRAVQKAVSRKDPNYKWSDFQKEASENMVADVFSEMLPDCVVYRDNYYPKNKSLKNLNENDIIISFTNTLFIVEVKAGSFVYTPPITDFDSHIVSYKNLIEKADHQCKNTYDYLMANDNAIIYNQDGSIKAQIDNKHISSIDELREQFNLSDIYCINLDYKHIFDLKLMDQIKEQGIKVKIIPNEMCVYGRDKFFDKLNKKACSNDGYCHEKCWEVLNGDLEWLNITRQGFTRAFLPYFENKVDIIKLSTRGCPLSIIDNYFMSFISGREDCIFNRYSLPEDKLEEYIKMRFKCSHNCFECLYCKNLFYKYVKEI